MIVLVTRQVSSLLSDDGEEYKAVTVAVAALAVRFRAKRDV